MNNIYGCETIVAACLIWIAVFISSRLLFAMFIVGSCVGTGISVALGVSARQLATGMWSYDSLQVCGSIGGIFYVWNKYSCVMAIFAGNSPAIKPKDRKNCVNHTDTVQFFFQKLMENTQRFKILSYVEITIFYAELHLKRNNWLERSLLRTLELKSF